MMRTFAYWVPALVLLVLTSMYCVRHVVPLIANDLQTRSRLALNEADLVDVTVEHVDGFNVVLGGTVDHEEQRALALDTVTDVFGVHAAIDQISKLSAAPVLLAPGQHRFSALADNAQVELTGMVRNPAMRASIVGAARRAFGERLVLDRLEQVDSTPQIWTTVLRQLLVELAAFSSGKLDVRGTHLSLVGSVTSAEHKERAEQVLSRVAADGFTHRLDVAVLSASSSAIENCQALLDTRLEASTIRFNSGSAAISVDSYPLLEELTEILAGCDGASVQIQGHTDAAGDDAANLALSEQRARAVQQYFTDEGINPARLRAVGFGETQPRADNNTPTGRARNRRIEFEISGN